ncbi:hypothetical protein BH23PAT1_BH23PAT1_1630 [soil metagenome]
MKFFAGPVEFNDATRETITDAILNMLVISIAVLFVHIGLLIISASLLLIMAIKQPRS